MSDENFDLSVHTWIPRNRYKTLLAQSQKQDIGIGHLIRAIIIATVPPTEELATRPPRLHDAERDEYIRRRNAEGASDGEIGRETGNSAGAITARRRRMGIPAARLVGGQPKPKEADA